MAKIVLLQDKSEQLYPLTSSDAVRFPANNNSLTSLKGVAQFFTNNGLAGAKNYSIGSTFTLLGIPAGGTSAGRWQDFAGGVNYQAGAAVTGNNFACSYMWSETIGGAQPEQPDDPQPAPTAVLTSVSVSPTSLSADGGTLRFTIQGHDVAYIVIKRENTVLESSFAGSTFTTQVSPNTSTSAVSYTYKFTPYNSDNAAGTTVSKTVSQSGKVVEPPVQEDKPYAYVFFYTKTSAVPADIINNSTEASAGFDFTGINLSTDVSECKKITSDLTLDADKYTWDQSYNQKLMLVVPKTYLSNISVYDNFIGADGIYTQTYNSLDINTYIDTAAQILEQYSRSTYIPLTALSTGTEIPLLEQEQKQVLNVKFATVSFINKLNAKLTDNKELIAFIIEVSADQFGSNMRNTGTIRINFK